MSKYNVWTDDEAKAFTTSNLAKAIKFIIKNSDFDESNSGLEERVDGEWDEWLDDDDQNIHEHLYMYSGKSRFLNDEEDDEDDIDDEEDDFIGDEDDEDRLLSAIGGSNHHSDDDEDFSEDDDELDDDEDFDDDEEDDE